MTEADKLKKLMEDTLKISPQKDLEIKIAKAIHDAMMGVLTKGSVNDISAVDLNDLTTGISLGISSVMVSIYPQVEISDRILISRQIIEKTGILLGEIIFKD